MMTALERANQEQKRASDPVVSAFVSASAGSGKTKLLTDRLLRLMLTGTPPEKILCLTYTKAAAAEMTNRLNRSLGKWVVLADAELDLELAKLDVPATAAARGNARKLFADVLDLPGGMRISTIHAFCQSLLRRFPLEAKLSPHFELEDEGLAQRRLRDAREQALANPQHRESIFALAEEIMESDFAGLVTQLSQSDNLLPLLREFDLPALHEMQRAALNAPEASDAQILAQAVQLARNDDLRAALQVLAMQATPGGQKTASAQLDWLALPEAEQIATWEDWCDLFLTKEAKPRSLAKYCKKIPAQIAEQVLQEIERECARILEVRDKRLAVRLLRLNQHLLRLVEPVLRHDEAQKTDQASVTYADLIAITLKLLQNPDDVAWVLYKLDGGIDHLLLDEVQDTAPAQWQIADAIADDFFAGKGARDVTRSIFAVGDPKQSIFSFQGADLESFQYYREKFRHKVETAGHAWLDGALSVSFRSTAPVLQLTDAVFAKGPACRGVCEPGSLRHELSRAGQAGRVSLWPKTKASATAEAPAWEVPEHYTSTQSARSLLAGQIAAYIKARLMGAEVLPSKGRAIAPGDFLILVRRRDEFVTAMTRACKIANIPIAGLDRMVLTEQPAVSDLMALCDALLLPEDDLAFGQFLVSPLAGLNDESLMALALGRRGSLANTLFARRAERPDWQEANAFFQNLRQKTDFISPFALLSEALGPQGGRTKLLHRLGVEAAEAIDELLNEAQNFVRANPASMQNFLYSLRQSNATIKREAETTGNTVRIMTVHGAKGLQAPVVILPDTTAIPNKQDTLFQLEVPQQERIIPVYCPRAPLRSSVVEAAATATKNRLSEEYNRLLYVALTRAEDELLVCGTEGKKAAPADCWYELVKAGFERLGAVADDAGHYVVECPQTSPADRREQQVPKGKAAMPAWAGCAPAWRATALRTETTRPEPLAPSRSAEEEKRRSIAASPLQDSRADAHQMRQTALQKGQMVHALLQHLPELPAGQREAAARHYLAQPGHGLDEAAQNQMQKAALQIVEAPALAALFGPGSKAEVPVAGVMEDVEISGVVDRLGIGEHEILIADYKTDRHPPAVIEEAPAPYLAQLAAYSAILAGIFPGRAVSCLLIWTENATIMPVPPALLARHAPAR